jgi:tRNA dimethylallyltransferase
LADKGVHLDEAYTMILRAVGNEGVGFDTIDRDALSERLRARVAAMFAAGFVDEVRGLHTAGWDTRLRPLRAIGYREVAELLAGRLDEPTARERIWIATRRYAKRQRTWFRAEPGLEWIDAEPRERALERALVAFSSR